jgi:hypothetical protein
MSSFPLMISLPRITKPKAKLRVEKSAANKFCTKKLLVNFGEIDT